MTDSSDPAVHDHDPAALRGSAQGAATDADGADGGGHGDHDGHDAADKLGPIDWAAWGAGILGLAAGALVAVCLYLATAA